MDYRGRGGSQWTGGSTYNLAREATDACELLTHLGLDSAAIIGTSRGGLVGMRLLAMGKWGGFLRGID